MANSGGPLPAPTPHDVRQSTRGMVRRAKDIDSDFAQVAYEAEQRRLEKTKTER